MDEPEDEIEALPRTKVFLGISSDSCGARGRRKGEVLPYILAPLTPFHDPFRGSPKKFHKPLRHDYCRKSQKAPRQRGDENGLQTIVLP